MIAATDRRSLDAVVLAAGFGLRLGALTAQRPKCLLDVGGRAILARTLDTLCDAGIRTVHLVVGHHADSIRAFADAWSDRIELTFPVNSRVAATGTAFSLARGLSHVTAGRAVLVIEADVVFARGALERLLGAHSPDATLVSPFAPHITGSAVECDATRHVSDWLHASHQEPSFRYDLASKTVNLTRLCAATVATMAIVLQRCIAAEESAPLEYAMRTLVRDRNARIEAVDVGDAQWFEVDTEEDLRIANEIFSAAPLSAAQR